MNRQNNIQTAVFAGGCFWCTEAIFARLNGVISVEPGYAGGTTPNPTYEEVCTGDTGHAEVIRISYDPDLISYRELLEIFFDTHDPTSLNRQGNDIGTQYRSVVFFLSEKQKNTAQQYIQELSNNNTYKLPIVTTLEELTDFYPAENYHHDYYNRNGNTAYCRMVIRPKINKFARNHSNKIKKI